MSLGFVKIPDSDTLVISCAFLHAGKALHRLSSLSGYVR